MLRKVCASAINDDDAPPAPIASITCRVIGWRWPRGQYRHVGARLRTVARSL